MTCRADTAEPAAIQLQLHDASGGVLAEGPPARLELRLVARREDDGRRFSCRASLTVGDAAVTKDAAAQLAVLCECHGGGGPAAPTAAPGLPSTSLRLFQTCPK